MKIIHVIPDLGIGGAEKFTLDLASRQQNQGAEVTIVSLYQKRNNHYINIITEKKLNIIYLNKQPGFDFRIILKLMEIFRVYKPEVINTHQYVVKYLLLQIISNKNIFHTIHNTPIQELNRIDRMIQKIAYLLGVMPISISKIVHHQFSDVYGNLIKSELIPNGINLPEALLPLNSRSKIREELGISSENVVLICVARLTSQKNHKKLLDIFSNTLDDAVLLIVGDGELRRDLESYASIMYPHRKIKFLGIRDDIEDLLSTADIFVLMSSYEGNPISVMEAMAAGLPVVATDVGGIPDLVDDGITGLLHSTDDEKGIINSLDGLIKNHDRRLKMGKAAFQKAQANFSMEITAQMYLKLYSQRLNKERRHTNIIEG